MSIKKFPIEEIYTNDIEKLLKSKIASKIIHSTGDIDASGDELELPIRKFLSKRLPQKYYVGHGHIVDMNMNVSPQFDIIIVDSNSVPILFDTENKTEYFPYESVYAIGEIKSTYYKNSRYVEKYIKSIQMLKREFVRENIDNSNFFPNFNFGDGIKISGGREVWNPLFTFMVYGSKNDYEWSDFRSQLDLINKENNPNIFAFFDGSIITKAQVVKNKNGELELGSLELSPIKQLDKELNLVDLNLIDDNKSGHTLSILLLSLMKHLENTRLGDVPFERYVSTILKNCQYKSSRIID